MIFSRFRRPRPGPVDAPMHQIAAALEATRSARMEMVQALHDDQGRKCEVHFSGFVDFVGRVKSMRRETTGEEHLAAGPALLYRLSEEQRKQAGRTWLWLAPNCPYWENEQAETAAALRLHVFEPGEHTVETVAGERLHHYVFHLKVRHDHQHPAIANLYDHLRHHGARKSTLETWLTEDGRLRRTREHATLPRMAQAPLRVHAWTIDLWDFDVATDVSAPPPEEILHPSGDTADLHEAFLAALYTADAFQGSPR